MRQLIVLSMLVLGSLSVGAFADETTSPAAPAANAPQCMQVQLDGKASTACFGLSDDQVQNLNLNVDANSAAMMERCEVRCVRVDPWRRCLEWRRVCW